MLLDRIALFVTAAKHQNLAKTARQTHVSASSVCQRLKSLEKDLGAKLYKRSKEGIELTEAGQILLTAAGEILNRIETLKTTLGSVPDTAVQSLTIAGTYNPSAKYLPTAIAAFQKTHPDIKINFLTLPRAAIDKMLKELEVDIAIIQSPLESADFHMEHFAEDSLAFFAHPAHPLSKKKKLELEDLEETPLIVRDGKGVTEKMLNQLKSRGVKPNVVLRCVSPDAVKAAVRNEMGIGIMFYNLIEERVKRKHLTILNFTGVTTLVGTSYIVYSKKRPLSYAAEEFLKLLRSRKARAIPPQTGG